MLAQEIPGFTRNERTRLGWTVLWSRAGASASWTCPVAATLEDPLRQRLAARGAPVPPGPLCPLDLLPLRPKDWQDQLHTHLPDLAAMQEARRLATDIFPPSLSPPRPRL